MLAGVSTASLYPMHTEDALLTLAELGTKNVEIFLNSFTETEGATGAALRRIVSEYGLNAVSLHPFSSPMESVFLFSDYDRRFDDMMGLYKTYFEFMQEIGAKYFVLHGAINSAKCSTELYLERLGRVMDAAAEYGVSVAQENISYCKSHSLDFLMDIKKHFGDRAAFVLDIKQAVRSHLTPFEIIDALGSSVKHVHISDNDSSRDCLPVGEGTFDFPRLVRKLSEVGFDGAMMIELYRDNYKDYPCLTESMKKIEKLFSEC